MNYTVGFIFDKNLQKVLLVHKLSPVWQKGRLNGVGGKIEPGEKSLDCIVREAQEEANVLIPQKEWHYFGTITEGGSKVDFYFSLYKKSFGEIKQTGKEKIGWFNLNRIPKNALSNLSWLLPFALNKMEHKNLQSFNVKYSNDPNLSF